MTDPIPAGGPGVGTVIVHRDTGDRHVIEARKRDGSGWWLVGGTGIADQFLHSRDWDITDETAEVEPRRRCPHCDHTLDGPRG